MKTPRLSKRTKARVSNLAVSYATYCRECNRKNDEGIVFWGQCLIEDQKDLDVQIISTTVLEVCVDISKRRLAEKKAA